jgi:hypothetical protein
MLESMLLTAKILPSAVHRRGVHNATSPGACRLSELICEGLCAPGYRPLASAENDMADMRRRSAPDVTVDELAEEAALDPLGNRSDVIGLRRLEGEDPSGRRYRQRYFVARLSGRPIACARAVWDALDMRVRLLDLKVSQAGGESPLIKAIVSVLASEQGQASHSLAVDVRADAIALHDDLRGCGFFPTAYYPALIADGEGRSDAVQFTHLHGFDFEKALQSANLSEWPAAAAVVAHVKPPVLPGAASGHRKAER